jgi:hypothetical protein
MNFMDRIPIKYLEKPRKGKLKLNWLFLMMMWN